MHAKLLDRVPRYLSLLGLLGLLGVGGFLDPQFWRFSALSLLSYVCYFRFFRWIVKPQPEVKGASLMVWLVGFIAGTLPMMIAPWLFDVSPMFGFIGFAGFLGLYEPAGGVQPNPAGSSRTRRPDRASQNANLSTRPGGTSPIVQGETVLAAGEVF